MNLLILAGLLSWAAPSARSAEEPVATLLPYLPESANVVAVIRVEKLLASPRGQAEGWANQQHERFLAGASSIPPGIGTIVLGMQFRPQVSEMVSSVSLATTVHGVSLKSISAREDGAPIDQIGGRSAVQSQHNAFYVELSKDVLAIVSPASRQEASRYVRHVTSITHTEIPTGYLGKTARQDHHIIMAMDLVEMANPARVIQELDRVPGVSGQEAIRAELLALLSSLEGVQFSADVTDTTQARLAIDFGQKPTASAMILKPMVMRIISDAGLHISELDEATAAIEDHSLVFQISNLSDASLRTVLSLVMTAAPVPESASSSSLPTPAVSTPAPTGPDVTASKRYFRTVNQSLDDLEKANRRLQAPGQNATWHENIAIKIDKLSTRGVDPDLVTYGKSMSQRLKGLAASLRGVAIEVDVVQGTLVWNSSYDPGATQASIWGGYGYQAPSYKWDSNLQQVREKQAEAVIQGDKDRIMAWQIINDERQKMTTTVDSRYGRQ